MALQSKELDSFFRSLPDWEKRNRNKITGQPWSLSCFISAVDSLSLFRPTRNIIEVVGSKLKGSLSANLAFYLSWAACEKIGVFSSPHIISPVERISIYSPERSNISVKDMLQITRVLESTIKQNKLTYFEAMALIAGKYFCDKGLKWSIWEAGLGGRLDATNAYENDYVVLTPLELEHTRQLGNSLEKIAVEKLSVVKRVTKKIFIWQFDEIQINAARKAIKKLKITNDVVYIKTRRLKDAVTKIAIAILEDKGMRNYSMPNKLLGLPGRMEHMNIGNAQVVLDVAHTPMSMEYVLKNIDKNMDICIFTFAKDKQIKELLRMLSERFFALYFVDMQDERLVGKEEILRIWDSLSLSNPLYIISTRDIKAIAQKYRQILITGSFRLIGHVKGM